VISEHLRALTTEALYQLADQMELSLPPDLPRALVIGEILDAYEEELSDRKEHSSESTLIEEKKFSISEFQPAYHPGGLGLCDRYNETRVHLLPRDPEWIFAFWDVNDIELEGLREESGYGGLFLRVCIAGSSDYFDIPVKEGDADWYVHTGGISTTYRIDVCAHVAGKVRILARSETVKTPRHPADIDLGVLSASQRALYHLSAGARSHGDSVPELPDNPARIMSSSIDLE
jgi:hypothetical protein